MVLLQMWLDIVTSTNCKANLQSGRDVQLSTFVLTFSKTISNQLQLRSDGILIPHLQ